MSKHVKQVSRKDIGELLGKDAEGRDRVAGAERQPLALYCLELCKFDIHAGQELFKLYAQDPLED